MVVETNTNSHRGTLFYSFEVPKDQNLLAGFKRHYRYNHNIDVKCIFVKYFSIVFNFSQNNSNFEHHEIGFLRGIVKCTQVKVRVVE